MFIVCGSHICNTSKISHPHPPVWNLNTNVTMLGTAMPAPGEAGLNPDDKG